MQTGDPDPHSSSGTGGEPGPCEVTKSHVLSAVFFPKASTMAGFSFSLFRRGGWTDRAPCEMASGELCWEGPCEIAGNHGNTLGKAPLGGTVGNSSGDTHYGRTGNRGPLGGSERSENAAWTDRGNCRK